MVFNSRSKLSNLAFGILIVILFSTTYVFVASDESFEIAISDVLFIWF